MLLKGVQVEPECTTKQYWVLKKSRPSNLWICNTAGFFFRDNILLAIIPLLSNDGYLWDNGESRAKLPQPQLCNVDPIDGNITLNVVCTFNYSVKAGSKATFASTSPP